jgi:HAD superfamily hydrolase (TIGR01509 family)
MTKGLLFDMDGVIVDTEPIHHAARCRVYEKYGIDYERIKHIPVTGRNTDSIFTEVHQASPFPIPLDEAVREKRDVFVSLLQMPIQPLPGIVDLLKQYHNILTVVLVSASARTNVDAVMENTGLGKYFQAFVYAEDVRKYKPDPEAFLLAAEKIQISPGLCIVFEDSNLGVTAAKRAGARVIGVKTGHGRDTLKEADLVVEDLETGKDEIRRFIGL